MEQQKKNVKINIEDSLNFINNSIDGLIVNKFEDNSE